MSTQREHVCPDYSQEPNHFSWPNIETATRATVSPGKKRKPIYYLPNERVPQKKEKELNKHREGSGDGGFAIKSKYLHFPGFYLGRAASFSEP